MAYYSNCLCVYCDMEMEFKVLGWVGGGGGGVMARWGWIVLSFIDWGWGDLRGIPIVC